MPKALAAPVTLDLSVLATMGPQIIAAAKAVLPFVQLLLPMTVGLPPVHAFLVALAAALTGIIAFGDVFPHA